MYAYKVTNNRQKSVREKGYKNKSRSIIMDRNSNINPKQKNNYMYQMKKEINYKRQDDPNLYDKKTSRNNKQKSIDNSIYNQNSIYHNSSMINNNLQKYQKKALKHTKKSSNNNNYKNITNNIYTLKESNKKSINKNSLSIITNSIKNSQYQKSQNLTTNSNCSLFSFSNIVNEPTSSNDKFEESKDNFYDIVDNNNIKIHNNKVLTTFVQIDDLTPIPDRVGAKQHYLAEHDYDEAKRAAVTCRRIEYSYNLRNVIKSEISLEEIITIQRWWREILRKRNVQLLKELQIQERIKLNDIQNYILFINKIHYIYTMHLVKKFIYRLKIKFGKLYYKNIFNRNSSKIQNAYRLYILKKKLLFKALLKRLEYKMKKRKMLYSLDIFIMDMNKLIKLQNFIKYYLMKKKESYYLTMAHNVHPFMYYYLKFGIGNNDKYICLIKDKTDGFLIMVQKWKNFTRSKKLLKSLLFLENIKFILRKKYFIFFILRIVERINSMMTYFLLKPLMNDILYIYYRKKMEKIIQRWKACVKLYRRRDILALNFILKLVNNYVFKPFIKQLKRKIYEDGEIEEL
jgi:hypothetical protein